MGKRFKSLDEKYMGHEPDFFETPMPSDPKERSAVHSKSTRWYSYFQDKKKYVQRVYTYCANSGLLTKKEIQYLKKCPDWKLCLNSKGHAFVRMTERGWIYTPEEIEAAHDYIKECMRVGKKIYLEKKAERDAKPKPKVIPPQERLRQKVNNTIIANWDNMVIDKWMEGEFDKKKVQFPVYSLFQMHGLKGIAAINMLKDHIQFEYDNVKGAYEKTCDQLVEGYSHIKKGDQRKMLDFMDKVFEEIERTRDAQRNARVRTKKPRSRSKQVEKLKFLQEADGLESISPLLIPESNYFWMYNVKTKKLTEFTTSSAQGMEVRGSTLYNWEKGRVATLRKPDEIIPQILNNDVKQMDKIWNSLTTKIGKPTGRINKDTILLRRELWKN